MTARRGLAAAALGALLVAVGSGAAHAQERVLVRRFSDVVAVRTKPGAREQVLYYFAPTAELEQGGHVEQGSSGHTEIYLSGGARISLRASGHAILDALSAEGDTVRMPILTMVEITGSARPLKLELPGGVSCSVGESSIVVEQLPKRLRVRNQVGRPLDVVGPAPAKPYVLEPGQEVVYPLLETPLPEAQTTVTWGELTVRYAPGVQVALEEQRLRVDRAADGELHADAPVSIGGVATRPGGGRLVVRNPRPAIVPPSEPAAGAEPAPEPSEPAEPGPTEETQR